MPRARHIAFPLILLVGCVSAKPSSLPRAETGHSSLPLGLAATSPDTPRLKRLKNGHYKVRKPWEVRLNGQVWMVQAGYSSNGITCPAELKAALGDGVEHPETWAAVFHDWLFTQPGVSREQADRLFYDLLIAYGVPTPKASLMYTTVRAYSFSKKVR